MYRLPLRIADIQDSSRAGRERVGFVRPQRRRANVSSSLGNAANSGVSCSLGGFAHQHDRTVARENRTEWSAAYNYRLDVAGTNIFFRRRFPDSVRWVQVSQNLKRDKISKVLSNIFLACLSVCFLCYPFLWRLPRTLCGRFHGLPSGPRVTPFYFIWFCWFRQQYREMMYREMIARWSRESFPVKKKNVTMPTY